MDRLKVTFRPRRYAPDGPGKSRHVNTSRPEPSGGLSAYDENEQTTRHLTAFVAANVAANEAAARRDVQGTISSSNIVDTDYQRQISIPAVGDEQIENSTNRDTSARREPQEPHVIQYGNSGLVVRKPHATLPPHLNRDDRTRAARLQPLENDNYRPSPTTEVLLPDFYDQVTDNRNGPSLEGTSTSQWLSTPLANHSTGLAQTDELQPEGDVSMLKSIIEVVDDPEPGHEDSPECTATEEERSGVGETSQADNLSGTSRTAARVLNREIGQRAIAEADLKLAKDDIQKLNATNAELTEQLHSIETKMDGHKKLLADAIATRKKVTDLNTSLKKANDERRQAALDAYNCRLVISNWEEKYDSVVKERDYAITQHGLRIKKLNLEHAENTEQLRDLYNIKLSSQTQENLKLKKDFDTERTSLIKAKATELEAQSRKNQKDISSLEAQHGSRIKKLNLEHAEDTEQLRESYSIKLGSQTQENLRLKKEFDAERASLIRAKTTELEAQSRKNQKDISNLEAQHITRMGDAAARHEDEKKRMLEKHSLKLKEMEDEARRARDEWRIQTQQMENKVKLHLTEMQDQEREHELQLEEQKNEHETRIVETVQKHKLAVLVLTQEMQEKERQLTTDFAQKTKNLRQELVELSTALIARDNDAWTASQFSVADLKKEPDEHIAEDFAQIEQLVGSLAALKWKDSQDVWTSDLLEKLDTGCGQRRLKQSILKNHIWELLQEYIFGSPFRLFGKEGRRLEKQWKEFCEPGMKVDTDTDTYSWPQPQIETERWRYITVRECRLALMSAVPSEHDPRYKVKKGFKINSDGLIGELKSSLSEMAHLQTSTEETIERLVKRMSIVWLEFGMHRCRILISLQRSNIDSLTSGTRSLARGPVLLNTAPGLGRYGNVNGFDLETHTTIGKRLGETLKLR